MSEAKNYSVQETGQLTHQDLRVGVGNFQIENGTASVGLWFFVRNHDELNSTARLAVGQTIEIAGYRVEVIDIEINEPEVGWVSLRIATL